MAIADKILYVTRCERSIWTLVDQLGLRFRDQFSYESLKHFYFTAYYTNSCFDTFLFNTRVLKHKFHKGDFSCTSIFFRMLVIINFKLYTILNTKTDMCTLLEIHKIVKSN